MEKPVLNRERARLDALPSEGSWRLTYFPMSL
jgi:hypothetical protein